MSPKISVIMPVLNPDPSYLAQAVRSVVSQTMNDWELVIVEDPSPRSAADILRAFPDPRIRHVRNVERTSLVAQLNRCLDLARGTYLARLDADDVAESDRFALQCSLLDSDDRLTVLGCQKTIIGPSDEVLGVRNYPITHSDIRRAIRRFNPIPHPGVMMRREFVIAAGGYSNDWFCDGAEDYELWWRLLRAGAQFGNHPERLLRYRIQPQQTKAKRLRQQLCATLETKRAYWDKSFSVADRLRYWAECVLLKMPPGLVMRVFLATAYDAAPDARKIAELTSNH